MGGRFGREEIWVYLWLIKTVNTYLNELKE